MHRIVLTLALVSPLLADEPAVRPVYHFTSAKNFINDPNGLVFIDREYHSVRRKPGREPVRYRGSGKIAVARRLGAAPVAPRPSVS